MITSGLKSCDSQGSWGRRTGGRAGRWAGGQQPGEKLSAGPARHSQHSEHTLQLQSRVQTTGCAAADQAAVNRGRGRPTHPGTHPPTHPHLRGPLLDAGQGGVWRHVGEGAVADAQAVQNVGNLVNVSKVEQGRVCSPAQHSGRERRACEPACVDKLGSLVQHASGMLRHLPASQPTQPPTQPPTHL